MLALAGGALTFEADAFRAAASETLARNLAIVLVFFAGVSKTFGESLVLFLNRVRPGRFLLSLVLTGVVLVSNVLATAVTLLLGTFLVPGVSVGLDPLIGILALANAPHLFGAFVLMPYVGQGLARLIEVWVLALTVFGLHLGLAIPLVLAAAAALSGWIVMRLLLILFGEPLSRLNGLLHRRVSGSPLDLDPRRLVEDLLEIARGGRGDGR